MKKSVMITQKRHAAEWQRGWDDCLDQVRMSLANYPNSVGDIVVMGHVRRIALEEVVSELKKSIGFIG